jgi:hypothetical protein
MIIDPHVNPQEWDLNELIDQMVEASVDGVVITFTHQIQPAKKYVEALINEEFLAFYGIEFKTEFGTLFFLPRQVNKRFFTQDWMPQNQDEIWETSSLFTLLDQYEGLLFLSHPYSRLKVPNWGDRAYTLHRIQGCETRIGRGLANRDFLADQIAELKGWSRLGSCSGDPRYLGSAVTIVSDEIQTQEDLYNALSRHICWPVEFESAQHPRVRYQGVIEAEGPRKISLQERQHQEAMSKHDQRQGRTHGQSLDHSSLDNKGFGLHTLESKTNRNWKKNLNSSRSRSSTQSTRQRFNQNPNRSRSS